MIARCDCNFRFDYVVADSWYSSAENMELIKQTLKSNFIIALKSNRLVALSQADKESNNYVNIDSLQPEQQSAKGGLVQRIRFSAVAGKASLQKRGWYSRRVVSGMQRFKFIV